MAADQPHHHETSMGDLPEACLAQAIALTTPRDACRLAAVSSAFRNAADSDHVWHRFIPAQLLQQDRVADLPCPLSTAPAAAAAASADNRTGKAGARRTKDAYLGLCDGGVEEEGCRVWLERASGAVCCALAARRLSLPWDDGEFSWKWTAHPGSRFGEVAELVDCTCLDIYARLPASALTPATSYAAYMVYGTADRHRGLCYPDQETTVSVGDRILESHRVCLRPDDAETRKFRGAGLTEEGGVIAGGELKMPRGPRRREDGWWEMEMGRLRTANAHGEEDEVMASFEIFGWYPKRGLLVESVEFRAVQS